MNNLFVYFEEESVLKFTYELEKCKQLAFLDVLVRKCGNMFSTSVFIKDTNQGDCINYNGLCPDKYKVSVIKTLLHRGFHVCSDWASFHLEINRLKQLLTNNNFPMSIIDSTVNNFLQNKVDNNQPVLTHTNIDLFYESQMHSGYKQEEKQLQLLIKKHLEPIEEDHRIRLLIYYKNKKLKNLLIKNNISSISDTAQRHHVVYSYKCEKDGCNSANYVGYTACTVTERFKMHTQNGSIKKHILDAHSQSKVTRQELINCTTILRSCNTKRQLIMTEAVLIKELQPDLNSQEEGCDRLLKIFKH